MSLPEIHVVLAVIFMIFALIWVFAFIHHRAKAHPIRAGLAILFAVVATGMGGLHGVAAIVTPTAGVAQR